MNEEDYLRTLRHRLRGFDDADDIVDEIRSHIVEKREAGAPLDDVLARLGTADELARRYIADAALARAWWGLARVAECTSMHKTADQYFRRAHDLDPRFASIQVMRPSSWTTARLVTRL